MAEKFSFTDEPLVREKFLAAKKYLVQEYFKARWPSQIALRSVESGYPGGVNTFATAASSISNIVGIGIGQKVKQGRATGELSLRVYVVDKQPMNSVKTDLPIPSEVHGLPTDVIAVGRPVLRQTTVMIRPARRGSSIFNANATNAGTFGCLVEHHEEGKLILSNNHVMALENHSTRGKDEIVQPATYDGGISPTHVVARLHDFVHVHTGPGQLNQVDAAVAKPTDPSLVAPEIIQLGRPSGVIEPQKYRWVLKTGRTTGKTRGFVDDHDVTIQIPFDGGIATFEDQILIWGVTPREYQDLPTAQHIPWFSEGGDSGSVVLDELTNHAVGLLFAGSDTHNISYANKITNVQSALGVTLI